MIFELTHNSSENAIDSNDEIPPAKKKGEKHILHG
jgi:hypothetical protein